MKDTLKRATSIQKVVFFVSILFWADDYTLSQPVALPRLQQPIEFDGVISPGEWEQIDTLNLVSHWPSFSEQANGRTRFRVAYDEEYFYFSAKCFDNPDLIQGPFFERDNWGMTMDQICIMLDTYNDNENGVIFAVTPTGSRIDVSLKNDAQGAEPIDISWNSYWEALVSSDSEGWSAEVRVPFSSLRFQSQDGNVTMGMIAYRYIARERQMDIYPDVRPDWGFWSFAKISEGQDISFSNLSNKRPWFTTPYVLAGIGHHHVTPDGSEVPDKIEDNKITAGLDVQHALTDNLNMDLTINTDFAQVEADDQVVNLSRFSLFFPEKRRFFLERSSIMEFGFEANNRLFYSRRIGIQEGQLVPLWGGVRLVGRVDNYDIGLLTMQSREKDDFPSENFGVFRLRRKVSKENSYIGGILTTRTDLNGRHNLAFGADGIINLFDNDYLKVNFAGTYSTPDTLDDSHLLSDRKRIYLLWENRKQVGFNYALSYSQVDKNYDPGLGFESRNNFKSFGDRISYGWFTENSRSLRFIKFDLFVSSFLSNTTNRIESYWITPRFTMEWKKDSELRLNISRLYDKVPSAFDLSDAIQIQPGTYVNKDITATFEMPTVNFLTATFEAKAGTFYGGDLFTASVSPIYIISKYLTLSGFYQYNHIGFSNSPDYTAHIGRLKIATSLNVKFSVNAFVQLNSLTKVSVINFRLRYNPKDGNDLYLVYNEILNNEGKEDPVIPFSESRAIILKYAYTFQL